MIAQGHIRTPLNSEAVARCEWGFGPIGLMPPDSRLRGPGGRALKNSFGPVQPGSEGGYQKVCMLAMCGVHLGPLYSISTSTVIQPYLQWFENAAARELFDFQENTSAVSQAYHKALSMVLENEVKVVLLASLNDQVVSLLQQRVCMSSDAGCCADIPGTDIWSLLLYRKSSAPPSSTLCRWSQLLADGLHDESPQLCIHASERRPG